MRKVVAGVIDADAAASDCDAAAYDDVEISGSFQLFASGYEFELRSQQECNLSCKF